MISAHNDKMKSARDAARRINHVSKGMKGLAVVDWAKKVHAMLGTKSAARVKALELVG
jgi:hypothetical protein